MCQTLLRKEDNASMSTTSQRGETASWVGNFYRGTKGERELSRRAGGGQLGVNKPQMARAEGQRENSQAPR